MKRIAITGGAGYIGCKLSDYFLKKGYVVDCIDWLKWGVEPVLNIIEHDNFNLHVIDICSSDVEPILKRADAVIHLAGIVGFPSCNADPISAYKVNVEGTKRVIDASVGKPFVYASSGSVYGALGVICNEAAVPDPISSYSIYKLEGEQMLDENAVILRPATAFGVSNRLRTDLLINDFVRKACMGEHMVLFEGHFKRTFISIHDLVRAFAWGIEKYDQMKGQVWNVGDEQLNYTKLDICNIIQQHIPNWTFEGNTTLSHDLDGRNYFVDYSKIRNLGFTADESLVKGIQNLVKVYRAIQ
jgi:nucleoside-diphosphate-sugar epimerase